MSRAARHTGLGLATAVVCAAGSAASAAQWSLQPRLQARTDFNSNRRLQADNDDSSAGLLLTLDSAFARTTETDDITFRPRVEMQRYTQDTALNTVNTSLQLTASHVGERFGYSALAGYARDSTLTTELAETGIVDTSTHRKTLNGSLGGAFNLSERQQLSVQASYANIEYPHGERFGLVGYRYPSVSGTYTYSPTSRMSLSFTAFGDILYAPESAYKARETGVRLGIDRSLSERLRLSASAGMSRTHTDEQGFDFFGFFIVTSPARTDHGSVWSVRLTRFGDLTQWSFSYDRSVQPSGTGVLVRRDNANVSATRHLSPRLSATLVLQRVDNDNFGADRRPDDRKYLTGDTGVEWHVSERTALSLTFGYSQARLGSFDTRAVAWRSALGIRWVPTQWSVSR
ncbi:MAG TPA: hypothetical protein VG994_09535 [Steroidobacteraceae bacterium]|nr:hypothetical protein [Steroidobacteraceae bacterium]